MDTHPAKSVDLRFLEEVLNAHRLEALPDIVADDFIEENPVSGQGPGRDGLRDFLEHMFTAFPDVHWSVGHMVAEGDTVMTWGTWHGTHLGTFLGIPPTGRRVNVEAWTKDVIRDDRISTSRIIMDNLGLLRQLGALPTVVDAPTPTG